MRFTLFSCALLLIVINSSAQVTTAENGLNTPNSTTVRLGGTLLQTTTLDLGSYDFHFMKNGTPYFSILNNGNIGIGNSSPGARLTFPDVTGTDPIGLSWYGPDPLSYGIHRTAGSWLAPDYQQLRLSWLTGIVLDPGMSYGKSYVNIVGNGLRVTSGNVGIGTTTPGVMLSLGGSVLNSKLAIWEGEYGGQIVRSGFGIAPGQFRFHVAGPGNRFSFLSDEAGTSEVLTIFGTGNVGIGNTTPAGRLHIKATTADASASDFQFTDNAGGNILSIRNDQKFTLGSGTQNTELMIMGTGPYAGVFSPVYGSVANNIIRFTDMPGNTRMTLDMSNGTSGKLQVSGAIGTGGAIFTGDNTITNVSGMHSYGDVTGADRYTAFGQNMWEAGTMYNAAKQGGGIYFDDRTGIPAIRFMIKQVGVSAVSFAAGITPTGNFLIGNSNDNGARLQVDGNINATGLIIPTGAAAGKVLTSDANGNATWQTATGGSSAGWAFGGNTVAALTTIGTSSNYDLPIVTNNTERMRIGANGNVGIGTTNINDATYKLFVEGNIRTRKVRIDHDNWPDYVFENNYQLTPLHEVEQYIQQQKHLPEVPSAAEVKKEGVDVGDNQAILLKKIEELTLYVIQQQKQLEAQQKKIEVLEKKIAEKN